MKTLHYFILPTLALLIVVQISSVLTDASSEIDSNPTLTANSVGQNRKNSTDEKSKTSRKSRLNLLNDQDAEVEDESESSVRQKRHFGHRGFGHHGGYRHHGFGGWSRYGGLYGAGYGGGWGGGWGSYYRYPFYRRYYGYRWGW